MSIDRRCSTCALRARTWAIASLTLVVASPVSPALGSAQTTASESTATARTAIAPLPVVFYSPETKTAVGAALNIFYRPAGRAAEARPSTVSPIFIYTFEKQMIASLEGSHYWDAERNVFSGGLTYIDFPSSFYGIGNENEPDGSEDYTTETYGLAFDCRHEFWPSLRVGVGVTYGRAALSRKEVGGLLYGGNIPGSNGGSIVGLALLGSKDSRNNITYPTAGVLSELSAHLFDAAFGSDFDYRALNLEVRAYRDLGARRILALRGLVSYTDGVVPFQVLPSLGGDSLLRGYFGGRFRDRQLVAFEGELRSHLWKRLGLVAFGGLGQVAHEMDSLELDAFHVAAGFGLRFLLIRNEGLNIRLDAGWGEDDSGTYISLGEAF